MPEAPKSATYTAVGLIVAGFVIIALGWYGAARLDHTSGQIPYVISGGITGLALVGAGLTLVLVLESRRDRALLAQRLDTIVAALHGGGPAIVPKRGSGDDPTAVIAQPAAATKQPAAVSDADASGLVVAGRTAYHRPSCHLLEGRADLPLLTAGEAAGQELTPCRICDPEPATANAR